MHRVESAFLEIAILARLDGCESTSQIASRLIKHAEKIGQLVIRVLGISFQVQMYQDVLAD